METVRKKKIISPKVHFQLESTHVPSYGQTVHSFISSTISSPCSSCCIHHSHEMANNGMIQDDPSSTVIQGGGLPDTYKPSPFVVAAHGISNANFAWDSATGFLTARYLRKVLTTPLVLFCLGVVSLFLLNCGLAMRRCFRWMRGLPFITPNTEKPEEFINYQRIAVVVFFNICLMLAFLMDFFSFIGNGEIDRAVVDFEKGVEQFQTLFDDLKIGATAMTGYATNLNGHFQLARFSSCYQINFLYTKITSFATNSQLLLTSVSNVDLFLNNLVHAVRTDILQFKNGVFYFLWLLGLLTIALLKSFQIMRRRLYNHLICPIASSLIYHSDNLDYPKTP